MFVFLGEILHHSNKKQKFPVKCTKGFCFDKMSKSHHILRKKKLGVAIFWEKKKLEVAIFR